MRYRIPKVGWLELLQDLVIVVLAMSLFSGLQFSWESTWVIWYLVAIVYVFGAWAAWVLASNRFPDDGIVVQLLTMVWIVGAMVAATGTLWHGWSTEETLNGGMALAFLALALRYAYAGMQSADSRRATTLGAALSLLASGILAAGTFTLPYVAMAVGPAIGLVGILVVFPRLLPPDATISAHHLRERLGQFVLILLGDTFLEIVIGKERGGTFSFAGIALAAAAVFLLWRAYFIHVLPTGPPARVRRMQGWLLLHLPLIIGVGLTSVTLAANAVPLPAAVVEELEAYTEDVGFLTSLGIAYLGLAAVTAASAGWRNRSTVVHAGLGIVFLVLHFLPLDDDFSVSEAAIAALALMIVAEVSLSRSRPTTDTTMSDEGADSGRMAP